MNNTIRFAYTPDPDDAFHHYALENKKIAWPDGLNLEFHKGHLDELNDLAIHSQIDVCAISSISYPKMDRNYIVMASGASVGRGYGPALACRGDRELVDLSGKKVGIPGSTTTGNFLLHFFYKGFSTVPLPFDEIEDAIASGKVDAGVLIHEELLNYPEKNLRRICCLGGRWYEATGLPFPVGMIVARRSLGMKQLVMIENLLFESMQYALDHPDEAMEFASQFGRGVDSKVRPEFVSKFANQDTLCMPEDVRLGMNELFSRAYEIGFIDHIPAQDIVDPLFMVKK